MTRNEYLERLASELKKQNAPDIDEIISEYDQHFAFKMADGYAEEEVASGLEDPEELARQFAQNKAEKPRRPAKAPIIIGLVFADIGYAMFFLLLFFWSVALGIFGVASALEGLSLIAMPLLPEGLLWVPFMPYIGSLVLGLALLALSMLMIIVTIYCFCLTAQITRAYRRWHKNAVSGEKYPPLPKYPVMSDVKRRRMRNATLVALICFGALFVLSYAVLATSAGSFGFWHVWGWFVS